MANISVNQLNDNSNLDKNDLIPVFNNESGELTKSKIGDVLDLQGGIQKINNKSGSTITLTTSDIDDSTSDKKYITPAEKALLGLIKTTEASNEFLNGAGEYVTIQIESTNISGLTTQLNNKIDKISIVHSTGFSSTAIISQSGFTAEINRLDSRFSRIPSLITGGTGNNSFININSHNIASGDTAFALGYNSKALANYAIALGSTNIAAGISSFAEGYQTVASGSYSHSEGAITIASGGASHSEGSNTIASGLHAHAQGHWTTASGISSHSQNRLTKAFGDYSHAAGFGALASGFTSFNHSFATQSGYTFDLGAIGHNSAILGGTNNHIGASNERASIIGGNNIILSGAGYTDTVAIQNLAIWENPIADTGSTFNALVYNPDNKKVYQRAITNLFVPVTSGTGLNSVTNKNSSNTVTGNYSAAFGSSNFIGSNGTNAFVAGQTSIANGQFSTALGQNALAFGIGSFAQGGSAYAFGHYSHARGYNNVAAGIAAVAQGEDNIASGYTSFVSGKNARAFGDYSFAGGRGVGSYLLASGKTSFNFSENNSGQTVGHGANANNSVILGGLNHFIDIGNQRSAIIGGIDIKLTGSSYIDTVAVPNLAIWQAPAIDTGSLNALVYDPISRKVLQRAISGSSGGLNESQVQSLIDNKIESTIVHFDSRYFAGSGTSSNPFTVKYSLSGETLSGTTTFLDKVLIGTLSSANRGEIYLSADTLNPANTAMYIVPPANNQRLFLGSGPKKVIALNLLNVTGIESMPAYRTTDSMGWGGDYSHGIRRNNHSVQYNVAGTTNGIRHAWHGTQTGFTGVDAGSPELMSLYSSTGNLLLGTTTQVPASKFTVHGLFAGNVQGSIPFPRLTETQRTSISGTTAGLFAYQTDAGGEGEGLYLYKSTGWVKVI